MVIPCIFLQILPSILVLSVMTVTEVHGWYGGYYWPHYFHYGGKPLGPVKMEDVDYGKTGIKYLEKRDAEADPQLLLAHPHLYGYPYVPLAIEPRNPTAYGYSAGAKLVVAKPKVEKRSAEADPEADPQLLLPRPYVYAHPAYVPVLPKPVAVEKLTPDAYGFAAGFKPVVAESKEE